MVEARFNRAALIGCTQYAGGQCWSVLKPKILWKDPNVPEYMQLPFVYCACCNPCPTGARVSIPIGETYCQLFTSGMLLADLPAQMLKSGKNN